MGPLRNKDNSGFDNLYCDKFIIFGDMVLFYLRWYGPLLISLLHSRDNVPYNLAKRIIDFASNEEKIEFSLNEKQNCLKSCKYPENIINRAFRKARLEGPAPLKMNSNNIPFVTRYYDNVNDNEKVKKIRRKFNDIQSDHLKNVFKTNNVILAQNQPKNLLRFLSKARFNTGTNNFVQLNGLFKCKDKRWTICSLYVNEGNIFNNMRWELRSHVNCKNNDVIYYSNCVYWKNGWQ